MRTTIQWTLTQRDNRRGEGSAVEFSCAQVVGWGGRETTIGSIEQERSAAGWTGIWVWKPWCKLAGALADEGTQSDNLGQLQRQIADAWLADVVGPRPIQGPFEDHVSGPGETPLEVRWGALRQIDQTRPIYTPWGRLGFVQQNKKHSSVRYSDLEWAGVWRVVFQMPVGHLLTVNTDSAAPYETVQNRIDARWSDDTEGAE